MKIVLIRYWDIANINTRLPESLNKIQGALPPLGIAYVAAALESAGHEVSIIDAVAEGLAPEEVRGRLERVQPDLAGVTAMTSSIHGALEAGRIAKQCGALVVAGGAHMALYPEETLSYDFIDYGIVGEGDESTVELVAALEGGRPVEDIRGLAYKKDSQVRVNGARIVDDLDRLPFPAYHLLPMDRYSSIIGLHPVSTAVTTRGCPYRCGFCVKGPSDERFRTRSPRNVVDEMEMLVKRHHAAEVMFYDDVLTLRRKHIVGICEEILRRGLRVQWESPTRINRVDPELLELMHRAGCRVLRYGVESGDPGILALMNKAIDIDQVRRVFRWTREAGIETFAYFILGYAQETPVTMRRTIDLAKELDPDYVMFTLATPYPRTSLYELAVEQGIVTGDYWRDFTLGKRMERIPYFVPDAEGWMKRAYREFYLRPRRIWRQVRKIRSWRDVAKNLAGMKAIALFRMKPGD